MASRMAFLQQTQHELEKSKRLGKRIKAFNPALKGLNGVKERTEIRNGIRTDYDVAIPLRDGTIVRGNITRSALNVERKVPVILNYSVYGKDDGIEPCVFPSSSGLDNGRISEHYLFEGTDALWWCPRGYAVATVDARGSFLSEGNKSYYSRDVGLDGYDIVEWLGAQAWSNGKVATYGASAYAMVQWLTAAEQPPSLAAIVPIDGMTDLYREMARKGGIKETKFTALYPYLFNWGPNLVEDSEDSPTSHPYFDEYWQSKIPALEKIKCPAYIICSWGDHCIHTRGTINGWDGIKSTEKFLELHQSQKWEWALTDESLHRQKAFLDKYLLDQDTEVRFWPKVRYTVRERYYVGEWRYAETFPIPETKYTTWYPTASKSLSRIAERTEQSISYDACKGEIKFTFPVVESLEFVGHSKLRLWVEADGADNLDLFITLRKLNGDGEEVVFPWQTIIDDGPIGFGFLRASRRELDHSKTTPWRPYHSHKRDLDPLKPGDIVPVDIEILPTSCRLRPGDSLQVVVSGHDYREYPESFVVARHADTVNKGRHVIHFGGKYDSGLLLPVLPPVSNSILENRKVIRMIVLAKKAPGFSDDRFLQEYSDVHAAMTKATAAQVPFLRSYEQVVCQRPQLPLPGNTEEKWDAYSVIGWSSLPALEASFRHPAYLASAGQHVFTDEKDIYGSLAVPFVDLVFDPLGLRSQKETFVVITCLPKSSNVDNLSSDLQTRADAIQRIGASTSLLRYALSRDITPENASFGVFAGTPFKDGRWNLAAATEEFYFATFEDASKFLSEEDHRRVLLGYPPSIDAAKVFAVVGRRKVVLSKDASW